MAINGVRCHFFGVKCKNIEFNKVKRGCCICVQHPLKTDYPDTSARRMASSVTMNLS